VNPGAECERSPVIALERISKSYGTQASVRNLSLEIRASEFVAIVGGSGAGKTTTLKLINRLVEPDSGIVRIEGESILAQPAPLLRRKIGYVFQGIGLFPHLTVAENIGITPELLGWEKARIARRIAELLELVALPAAYALRSPAELSGGERQRVGVARALAAGPKIMLLDEPFGALDPLTRETLGSEYRDLHNRMGLTTVMVTHDLVEAAVLADRIVVMRAGEIVASGSPRELLHDRTETGDSQVRDLLAMPLRQAQRVAALVGGMPHE
jgi:osmoprotectant transport system ATP-binding protein